MKFFVADTQIHSEMGGPPFDYCNNRYCVVGDGERPQPFLLDAIAQSNAWDERIHPIPVIVSLEESSLSDAWEHFLEEMAEEDDTLDHLAEVFIKSLIVGTISDEDRAAIHTFVKDVFEEES